MNASLPCVLLSLSLLLVIQHIQPTWKTNLKFSTFKSQPDTYRGENTRGKKLACGISIHVICRLEFLLTRELYSVDKN